MACKCTQFFLCGKHFRQFFADNVCDRVCLLDSAAPRCGARLQRRERPLCGRPAQPSPGCRPRPAVSTCCQRYALPPSRRCRGVPPARLAVGLSESAHAPQAPRTRLLRVAHRWRADAVMTRRASPFSVDPGPRPGKVGWRHAPQGGAAEFGQGQESLRCRHSCYSGTALRRLYPCGHSPDAVGGQHRA